MTLEELIDATLHAGRQLMCADYAESTVKRDREASQARDRLSRLSRVLLPHDRAPQCPVMPGTPVLIRYAGSLVESDCPERLDWTQISEWRPQL